MKEIRCRMISDFENVMKLQGISFFVILFKDKYSLDALWKAVCLRLPTLEDVQETLAQLAGENGLW